MNIWDSYYASFEGSLLLRHRLNVYLKDTEESIHQLSRLGYVESTYAEDNTVFAQYLDYGRYCFTTTFEGEDDAEEEVPVIEIQHQPPRKHISLLSTGLCFMESALDIEIKEFVAENFGFSVDVVHSVCMFEGDGHYFEAKGLGMA